MNKIEALRKKETTFLTGALKEPVLPKERTLESTKANRGRVRHEGAKEPRLPVVPLRTGMLALGSLASMRARTRMARIQPLLAMIAEDSEDEGEKGTREQKGFAETPQKDGAIPMTIPEVDTRSTVTEAPIKKVIAPKLGSGAEAGALIALFRGGTTTTVGAQVVATRAGTILRSILWMRVLTLIEFNAGAMEL